MQQYPGTFIMIDGIDGSGKSTLVRSIKEHYLALGKNIFDLSTWHETNEHPPTYEDHAKDFDILMTFEPSKTWVGRAIREEIGPKAGIYSPRMQAEAFALDRAIQFTRLIIPALRAGKIVIQDRGVSTSLVYQANMDDSLNMRDVEALHGNQLALSYAPQHLITLYVDPHVSLSRRNIRQETSNQMYEKEQDMIRWQEIFHGSDFRGLMERYGTRVHRLDTSGELDETIYAFKTLINSLIHL